jgi:hypothetical protein
LALTWVRLGQPDRALGVLAEAPDVATSDPRLLMRWEFTKAMAIEVGQRPALPAFKRALECALKSDRPEAARCLVECAMAPHLPAGQALETAERLWDQNHASQELLTVLRVRVCLMDALRRVGRRKEAAEHAQALLAAYMQPGTCSSASGQTWWLLHQALRTDGRVDDATSALDFGRRWIERAATAAPAEFRNQFRTGPAWHRALQSA